MSDRMLRRQRTLRSAKIIINDRQSVISCAVKDFSETGAKLKLATVLQLPLEFELYLVEKYQVIPVRTVWQKGEVVGVKFVGEPQPMTFETA